MRKVLTLATGGWLLFTFACKKADLPNDIQENPIFHAAFQFGGQPDTLTAGLHGIYLFTGSYRDDHQPFNLTGSFAPADCPAADCPGTFTVRLRTRAILDSTFADGDYGYYWVNSPDSTIYQMDLQAVPGFAGPYECVWTLRDSLHYSGPMLTYFTQQASLFRVRQEVSRSDGFLSTIERQISPQGVDACPNVNITTLQVPGDTFFRLHAVITPAFDPVIAWSTGSNEPLIAVMPAPGESYSVTVTNPGNSCTATASLRLPDWAGNKQTANFTVDVYPTDLHFQNLAVIEWIDGQGIRWSSQLGPQANDAQFQVLDATPYEKNERGEPTRKLRIRFDCRLYNDGGAWQTMSGETVVAVGWPG